MSATVAEQDPIRPLSVREYYLLNEQGCFEDQRVELLEGVIYPMGPQKSPHAGVIVRLTRSLALALPDTVELRIQLPLTLSDHSEPEPDVTVCEGSPRSSLTDHPSTALLVIEVSDTSRRRDLVTKLPLYAGAAIAEYWVIDLPRQVIHVHQRPARDEYELTRIAHRGETLVPLAFPTVALSVDAILGPPTAE